MALSHLCRKILDRRTSHSRLSQLAAVAARDCLNGAWERAGSRACTMSVHEARGYLRARSAIVVRRRLESEADGGPRAAELFDRVSEALVRLLLDRRAATLATPAPARRAA